MQRPRPFTNRQDRGAAAVLARLPSLAPWDVVHPRVRLALQAWEPGKGNLLICGSSYAGKTSGVSLRIRELLEEVEEATSTLFIEAQELVDDERLRERAKLVRWLVVDDLGQEDDPKNRLFQVYNARYKSPDGLETITTCGRTQKDLERRPNIGSHMIKRILECQIRGKHVRGAIVDLFEPLAPTQNEPVGAKGNPKPPTEVD